MPLRRETKTILAATLVAIASTLAGPVSTAQARDHGSQVSFLARMMIDVTTHQLTLENDFLIRLPDVEGQSQRTVRARGIAADDIRSMSVVALLGRGLDVASPIQDDAEVRLQLKPNFGSRGGLLRCTFRF